MSPFPFLQYALFLGLVGLLVRPLGAYLARVFAGERTLLDPALRPVERGLLRLAGVRPDAEMTWKEYAAALLVFSLSGTLLLYALLRLQPLGHPPDAAFRPGPLAPDLAMNTAISFATTTTWQVYGGETTMSYLSQMVGLMVQNFLAAAAGLAVGIAFIRGLARQRGAGLGNFWVDLVRGVLWVLLPLALVLALALVAQGVPMNVRPYEAVALLQPAAGAPGSESGAGSGAEATQVLPMGPIAALESIKNLGTNGGGFFNVNAAHPFENPTPLTNLLEMLAIVALPAGLTYTFGRMVGDQRQGWLLFAVMTALFAGGLAVSDAAEKAPTPALASADVDAVASGHQPGGNMEGKEARFGVAGSVLGAVATSNGATGSYNSMYDSYTPLGGAVVLVNLMLGEVVYGGLGSGLVGLIFAGLVALFIGALMVGRAPEYLGKSLGPPEVKLVALFALRTPLGILLPAALAVATPWGRAGLTTNGGPHGLTEILVAFASCVGNNGLGFAGLSANSPFYNVLTAFAMMLGRFGPAILALALAGRFVEKAGRPPTSGTLPTHTPLFGVLLLGAVVVIGALSFLPALALGPLVEHLLMR